MLTIDCYECVMRATAACEDCVVSFVVGREPGEALVTALLVQLLVEGGRIWAARRRRGRAVTA